VLTVQSIQSVWILTWQGRTTRGRVIQNVIGSRVDSWHITWLVCSEWDGDTWPNQWMPRVTWILV
jgi:hypothetical protein